ncbi:NAD+ synthetase [Fibrobacter succinogenes subsp. succinogenes S85]|nr:NAD(+) synthase [Fibrobacter succinogenes]ACX76336.1 NAD+ synthetase [Fibrobacter succinogenes subsp. succinogenes S85]
MKLYVVQMKILPGNVSANMQTMKAAFDRAKAAEVDCVVFPRYALTGPSNRALPVDWAEIRKYAGNMPFFLCGDVLDDTPLLNVAHVTHGSDFYVVGRREVENKELSHLAQDCAMPVVCLNGVGTDNTGKNIYALSGGSRVFDCDGKIVFEMPLFSEAEAVIEFVDGQVQVYAESSKPYTNEIAEIHDALVFMIRENLKMFHISRMVIGASGGIDSAVSAALYAEAIGPENVYLVNMPTRFNSDTTKNAARDLAENLGTPYMVAPISDIIESVCHTLERCSFVRNDTVMKIAGINHENLQARTRSASILSTVASVVGAGVTCNGNKSEAMVGYCTLYGDTCGVMCALGDLWKTQVYELARYINRDKEIIPKASIDIPASAELSDAMNVDEGKGDPILYPYHDKLFAMWVEKCVSLEFTEKLLLEGTLGEMLGVDAAYFKAHLPTTEAALEDMRFWYRRFKGLALAKRIQFPPILSVSGHAFGGEYRESQISG